MPENGKNKPPPPTPAIPYYPPLLNPTDSRKDGSTGSAGQYWRGQSDVMGGGADVGPSLCQATN